MDGMPFEGPTGEKLRKALLVAVSLLGLFLLVQTISACMGWRYIGAGIAAANTISVTGHGEEVSVPDIATFTFSVVSDKATVAEAQADATAKANALTSYLTSAGVDAKDIQTSDYSIEPQYAYSQVACPEIMPVGGTPIYCPPSQQTLKGYEVQQTTTVKVRDTTKAGDLLAGVGSKGATQVSGLTFTFDDPTGLQTQARAAAITDAKAKAQVLAQELGVSLVRVVSFSENGNGANPVPMMALAAASSNASAAPTISVGQNKVTDDVTVTYEIR